MSTYTEEEYREVVKKHNALMSENFLLDQENQALRDVEHSECWGWKVVSICLCVYIFIDVILRA